MLVRIVEKVRAFVMRNFVVGILLVGATLLLVGHFDMKALPKWSEIVKSLGIAVLSSGIFAGVLKSIQFNGIFRTEIAKVMLSNEFLTRRKDLPELWRIVSKTLYKRKFPDISEDLEDLILNKYFPTGDSYYYEDFCIQAKVHSNRDGYLELEEVIEFTIRSAGPEEEIHLEHLLFLDLDENQRVDYELQSFVIDGQECADKLTAQNLPSEDGSVCRRKIQFSHQIKGKETYRCRKQEKKIYSLRHRPYKEVRVGRITKGLEVTVDFSEVEGLGVDFIPLGVIGEFETKMELSRKFMSKSYRDGLILPNQGFAIVFKKI